MKDNKEEERKERREKKKKKKQQKKENRHFIRHTVFSLITVLILNIAGSFPGFCDFYTDHIYVYPAAVLGFIIGTQHCDHSCAFHISAPS